MPNPNRVRRRTGHLFDPTQVPGLHLWLDAGKINGLADGAAVALWPDSSRMGNHATQTVGSQQGLYKTNIQNNRPAVLLDGVDDFFSADGAASQGKFSGSDVPFSFFAVVKQVGTAGTQEIGCFNSSSNANPSCQMDTVSGSGYRFYHTSDSNTSLFAQGGTLDTNAHIVEWHFDGTNVRISLDGLVLVNATATAVGACTFDRFSIGAYWAAASQGVYFNGYIFEVLLYRLSLAPNARRSIRWYLAAKYGITAAIGI